MKEHIIAELTNEVTAIAVQCHDHQSLRQMMRTAILEALNKDNEWYRQAQLHQPNSRRVKDERTMPCMQKL